MAGRRAALKYAKSKRDPGGFVALADAVIRSRQFARLSPCAVKLLIDLLAQYRGNNNGDLCATWNVMRERGWRSRDTLGKALGELRAGRWIEQTRQGGLHAPSLYGVTFFALDPSSKLEVTANSFPRGEWYRAQPVAQPQTKRGRQHAKRVSPDPTSTPIVSIANAKTVN